MTVSCTSKAAYRDTDKAKGRSKVLAVIRRRPKTGWTRQEISKESGIPINVVCPRVLELLESGDIVQAGYCRKSAAGKPCNVVRLA